MKDSVTLLARAFGCHLGDGCNQCGWCCHFRKPNDLTSDEDFSLRKYVCETQGVVYIFPLSKYSASLSLDEKNRMLKLAKELNVEIKIIPKRVYFAGVVIDYSFDHDVCPFLIKKGEVNYECRIHNERPQICKIFPGKPEDAFFKIDLKPYGRLSNDKFEEIISGLKKALDL